MVLLGACGGPHTLITARHTPCKPREIAISELTYTGFGEDWLATCGKLQFRCRTREEGHRLLYSCRPLRAAGADAGAPDATTPDAAPEGGAKAALAPEAAVDASRAPDAGSATNPANEAGRPP